MQHLTKTQLVGELLEAQETIKQLKKQLLYATNRHTATNH